jgi:hypothetical protein
VGSDICESWVLATVILTGKESIPGLQGIRETWVTHENMEM